MMYIPNDNSPPSELKETNNLKKIIGHTNEESQSDETYRPHKRHLNPPGGLGNNLILGIDNDKNSENTKNIPMLLSKKKKEVTGKVGTFQNYKSKNYSKQINKQDVK